MRNSRRMKRMGRNRKKVTGLHLTPLMDVFTILVFFLLFHSAGGYTQANKAAGLGGRGQTEGDCSDHGQP